MHWKDDFWGIWKKRRNAILLDESEDWGGEYPEIKKYRRKKLRQTKIDDFGE